MPMSCSLSTYCLGRTYYVPTYYVPTYYVPTYYVPTYYVQAAKEGEGKLSEMVWGT
jgi:hypothetical protein